MIIILPLFCNSFAVVRLAINPLEKTSQDNEAACLFELELAFRISFLYCLILNLSMWQRDLFGQAICLLSGVSSLPDGMLWGFFCCCEGFGLFLFGWCFLLFIFFSSLRLLSVAK